MNKQRCGNLVGLYGMPKRVPGWWGRSRTHAMQVLRKRGVVWSASDNGCVTVWKMRSGDSRGKYRVEFSRRMCRHSEGVFTTLAEVSAWLKQWWPKMNGG